jgi:hypothetical protein
MSVALVLFAALGDPVRNLVVGTVHTPGRIECRAASTGSGAWAP